MRTAIQRIGALATFSILLSGCLPRPAVEPAPEDAATLRWEGTLNIMNATLTIQVQTWTEEGVDQGTIVIPQQTKKAIPLSEIHFAPDSVHFEMLSGVRLAVFNGAFIDENTIEGDFSQMGATGTFRLERVAEDKAEEPVPYRRDDVTFENGNITLAGTLTLPEGEGPFPALVLISGSGPQNRDEEIPVVPGYKPFQWIGVHLTRQGIAVLRYDDRGVGESTGEQSGATSADFAEDAEAGLDYLLGRADIRAECIGLMGHSEGSLIAAMLGANRPEVAYIISMGGSAASGYDLLRLQQERIFALADLDEEERARQLSDSRKALDLIVAEDWETLEEHIMTIAREQLQNLPEEQRATIEDLDAYARQLTDQQMENMQGWMHFFVTYDPAQDWSRIKVPVLALQGGLDTQVDAEQAQTSLEAALDRAGNMDLTVKVFPEANHLFQEAVTGHPNEYASLATTFVPGFLETITDWLLERIEP